MANIYEHQVDTPLEVNLIGIPAGGGEVVLRYPLPVLFDYHHVEGEITIVAYDYTARPTINNVRLVQSGRQLVIVNIANLQGLTMTYGGVAVVPVLSLRDTDLGFKFNTDYDQSSNIIEIRMTVTANPAVAGFMLAIRPRLTITNAARNIIQGDGPIVSMPSLDGIVGRIMHEVGVGVKFGAHEEPAK